LQAIDLGPGKLAGSAESPEGSSQFAGHLAPEENIAQGDDSNRVRSRLFRHLRHMAQFLIHRLGEKTVQLHRMPTQQHLERFPTQSGDQRIAHCRHIGKAHFAKNHPGFTDGLAGTYLVIKVQRPIRIASRNPQAAADHNQHAVGYLTFGQDRLPTSDLLQFEDSGQIVDNTLTQRPECPAGVQYFPQLVAG